MARGSSYGERPTASTATTSNLKIPRRATRIFQTMPLPEDEPETLLLPRPTRTRDMSELSSIPSHPAFFEPHLLTRHHSWLTRLLFSLACVVIGALVLSSVGVLLRPSSPSSVMPFGGQSYPLIAVQLGGSLQAYDTWAHSNGPIPEQTAIPTNPGPYSVLGKPTISADFINQVLASYNSPTAGMGQTLYDLGVKYGMDPVYPLAFFMHESLFGTTGEARATLSLGNSRCIPDRSCIDQDRGGYAKMNSWQDGFEQWYKLIRNLYIAQWGRVTVDQIIPKYAPNSDGNNETSYIALLKHEIDTWRAGILRP